MNKWFIYLGKYRPLGPDNCGLFNTMLRPNGIDYRWTYIESASILIIPSEIWSLLNTVYHKEICSSVL